MDTKFISKLFSLVLMSICSIIVSCSNKPHETNIQCVNNKEIYINVFLNEFYSRATDAFVVVNVKNKSITYPAITTLESLENYIIQNTHNKELSHTDLKDECRRYLLNDSVLMYNIGVLYIPNSTEELWAVKGENEYITHYAPNHLIIGDLTEHELFAVIYRLIKWGYFVLLDGWGCHVIKLGKD